MKMRSKTLLAAVAAAPLLLAAPAFAQDNGWSGEASLTGSRTTGNTDTTDLGLGLNIQKKTDLWNHTLKGTADFGRNDGETNKQRFTIGYQIDRNLTDRLYVYGNADYFNDDFGAFQDGYFLGTGLGYKLVEPAPFGWDVEAGVGYRSQNPQEPGITDAFTQADFDAAELAGDFDRTNEVALRGASKMTYDFNESVALYNNSEVIWSSSDTYLWNEFGLTANLVGNLAARASYRVDHHTDVLPGVEKTDTITRFGLVYTMN